MSYTTGVATDYKNLLSILATFIAANGWTILNQNETLLQVRGSGDGTDEIYGHINLSEDSANSRYVWEIAGSVYYRADKAWSYQPRGNQNYGGTHIYAAFWNAPITYWITCNSYRFIIVAKVSTYYKHMHFGFIKPCATKAQYPYPLLVGGMGSWYTGYSDTGPSAYWSGNHNGYDYAHSNLYLPDSMWAYVNNSSENSGYPGRRYCKAYSLYHGLRGSFFKSPDGSYLLAPYYIRNTFIDDIYGEIDGIYWITGYENTSENIVTVNGVNYIVFQDNGRSGYADFCALRMN